MTAARILELGQRDRIDSLITQVIGVLQVIGAASQTDNIPTVAVTNAAWAAEALLDQLREVINSAPRSGEVTQ